MTLNELSQLFYLSREIQMDGARLRALEDRAYAASGARLDGMPGAPHSGGSHVERIAIEIEDLRAVIAAKEIQCIHERARLERYIADIPDSLTRMVFTHRFVHGLSWLQVAMAIGGGNTPDGVKKICYRYIRAQNARDPVLP